MMVNLKNIDLNLLVIFEAVYATGNISRAAERLGMSQPAVSNALARLREVIDDPLFVRAPRGVEPTAKTRQLIIPVRDSLGLIGRHLGAAAATIDIATYKRLFRIVMADMVEALLMPPVLNAIAAEAPGIAIECVQAHPSVFDEIRAGAIDLALFIYPIDTTDIVVEPIGTMDAVVVSRRDHPEIKKPLDVDTFQRLAHVALARPLRGITNADNTLAANMMTRRVVYMVAKFYSMAPIVERTDLIGMLPRVFADELRDKFNLDLHELPFSMPAQNVFLAWHSNSQHDPGHIWLREQLLQAARVLQ